jgi:hypothetical integral membrane protein (TIGR02206 family)
VRTSHLAVIVSGFVVILGAQAVYTLLLGAPSGVRIRSPEGNVELPRSFVVAGDAWVRGGISHVEVQAVPRGSQDIGPLVFPAVRDAVRGSGKVLFGLSSWSSRLELPANGPWDIRAVATGTDGTAVGGASRGLSVRTGVPGREFRPWTAEHVVPVIVILVFAFALGAFAKGRQHGEAAKAMPSPRFMRASLWLTVVVWANEIAYQAYWFLVGGWSVTGSLMLQMCGLAILFLPVMLLSEDPGRRQRWFDVLYFWGIGGAIQALIAPDIGASGFPAYRYFSFFLSHGLIITMTVLMALAGGVTITWRSLIRAFVVTNVLLIPIYGVDQLLRFIPPYDPGNYFVLGYPPPTGSVVDVFARVFGPAPRYVIGLEAMGLAIFLVLLAPWPIARLASMRRSLRYTASARGRGEAQRRHR